MEIRRPGLVMAKILVAIIGLFLGTWNCGLYLDTVSRNRLWRELENNWKPQSDGKMQQR